MFKPVYLFLVILFWTIACQPCPQGQTITTTKNTCSPIQYIQGCYQYLKQGQCSACQFNYDLTNGFCNYNQRKASQCCKAFNTDGSCKECEIGLFLEDGACKQIKIAGCLWKNGSKCGNCAQGFYLGRDGRCGKGLKGCGRYDTNNGNCLECQQGYTLTTGLCSPTVILGCKSPQTPTSCNSCHPPFTLSTLSTCTIPSCKSYNQFGCIQCQTGFYLTPNFTCSEMFAGCEIAQRGVCYLCASAWTLSQGRCRLDGCNKEDGRKMCTGCDAPARLQNGYCKVENCLRQKNGRCEVCQGNYNLQKGSCVKSFYLVINSTADICTACQQGYTWTENNKCSKIMIGCSKYENGKCKTCQTGFEMEENNKCWIDGCENLTSSGCMVCMKPYRLENRKCRLENCGRSRKGRCVGCNEGYVSREGVCVVRDGNCQNYNDQGVCTGCRNGRLFGSECITNMITGCVTYSSSDRNRCQNCNSNFILNDGRCIVEDCDSLDNNGCVTCRNPFKLVRGKCRLDNCRQSGNGICQVCQDGWVRKNGFCTVVRDGNCQNYNDQGVCTGCRNGRLFGSECITNMITGCVTYSSSDRNRCQNCNSNFILNDGRCIVEDCDSLDNNGCVTCRNPFKLVRGKCRLDNCRQSGNGICQVCQDGWVRKNGFCTVVRDGNCQNYNDQGVCTGCRNGRLFGSECITNMITGCVTYSSSDRNRCQNCNSNFILNDGRCIVEDCDSLDNNGCVTCRNPFKLVRGKCRLDNCRQSGNGICQVCQDGWVRKNGFCTVVRDGNCQNYNDQGVCTGCRNGRLFGSECITNMITGCVTYSSSDRNRCQNCNSNFILNDGRCIVEDCDSLDNNGCVTCRNPFKLVRGKCRLDNCRQSGNGICQVCQDGWVRKNGFCTVVRDGNCQNYNDQGVCTGCRNGRLFGSECITNMITGCVTYSSSDRNRCQNCNSNFILNDGRCIVEDCDSLDNNGCVTCRNPFKLVRGKCRLDNCRQSGNGICQVCQDGWVRKNGFCTVVRDGNCQNYNDQGVCTGCRNGRLFGSECITNMITGCVTYSSSDRNRCQNCNSNFILNDGRCIVEDCDSLDNNGCVTCRNPFKLVRGKCRLDNCRQSGNGICQVCQDGWVRKNGFCTVVRDGNCQNYNDQGVCTGCRNGRLFGSECITNMITGCVTYSSSDRNRCQNCNSNFILNDGRCIVEDCDSLDNNGCVTCRNPFKLVRGKCRLDNCRQSGNGICQVCQDGWVRKNGFCTVVRDGNCQNYNDQGVCTGCRNGRLFGSECITNMITGCVTYSSSDRNRCQNCNSNFILNDGRCIVEDCDSLDNNGCVTCRNPFKLVRGKCRLDNCRQSGNGICQVCQDGWVRKNGFCTVVRDGNCQNYNDQGVCTGCRNGRLFGSECITNMITGCVTYSSSDRNRCQNCNSNFILNDGRCIVEDCDSLDNNGCVTCRNPFKLVRGKCRLDNCRQSGNGICQVCQDGWVRKNGFCTVVRDGNCQNYNDQGVCTGCRNGRLFGSECITNMITGCVTYSSSDRNRCQNCNSNTLLSPQGQCRPKDPNCLIFNFQGTCTSCRPNWRLFNSQCISIIIIGCNIYSPFERMRCQTCNPNFVLTPDGRCTVENCINFDNSGCMTCNPQFQLVSGRCQIRMSQPVPQNNNNGGGCNPGGGHHGGRNGGRNGGCSPPPSYNPPSFNPCVPQYQPYRPAFSPCQPSPCFRRC